MSSYSIESGKLRVEQGVEVTFAWPVTQVIEVGDVLVARTESPPGEVDNRNVYGVLFDGNIVWRVQPVVTVYEDSPFVSLVQQGENVVLGNWDGLEVVVEAKSGREVGRGFRR